MTEQQPSSRTFQRPTGTRDFYPDQMLQRRYVEHAWRSASLRHGFDEIEGPTFEHLDLYTVKSGEGIVSELFSFRRFSGEKDFALRPEFTPTLARMYAARAGTLPRPTRWFSIGPYFRAERPQRGRLREFIQWNADVLGDDSVRADAEVIACAVDSLSRLGLTPADVKIRISHRMAVETLLTRRGVARERLGEWYALLDKVGKINSDEFLDRARALGMETQAAAGVLRLLVASTPFEEGTTRAMLDENILGGRAPEYFRSLFEPIRAMGVADWCVLNLGIVRGLAYYTGMVFEIHDAEGKERAVAGGGRYDNLVELFGGPPTPAVGFGMGDAVLTLLLERKGKLPDAREMADRIGARPDAFVLSNGTDEAESQVLRVAAALRRQGLHARYSSKATRNVGKLLKEASSVGARYAVIVESASGATIKDLDTGTQSPEPIPLHQLGEHMTGR